LIIVKVDRARSISRNKHENIFYSKICKNIGKLRTSCPMRFLRRILKKNERKKRYKFAERKTKKKKNKKHLQNYTPCLDSKSVMTGWLTRN